MTMEDFARQAGRRHGKRRFTLLVLKRHDIGMELPPEFLGKLRLGSAWVQGQAEAYTEALNAYEKERAEMVKSGAEVFEQCEKDDPLGIFNGEDF